MVFVTWPLSTCSPNMTQSIFSIHRPLSTLFFPLFCCLGWSSCGLHVSFELMISQLIKGANSTKASKPMLHSLPSLRVPATPFSWHYTNFGVQLWCINHVCNFLLAQIIYNSLQHCALLHTNHSNVAPPITHCNLVIHTDSSYSVPHLRSSMC